MFALTPAQIRYALDELKRIKEEIRIEVDTLTSYPICLFDNQNDYDFFGAKRCSAGRNLIIIGIDGPIRPCPHLSLTYGNIFDGFNKTWEKMEKNLIFTPIFQENLIFYTTILYPKQT